MLQEYIRRGWSVHQKGEVSTLSVHHKGVVRTSERGVSTSEGGGQYIRKEVVSTSVCIQKGWSVHLSVLLKGGGQDILSRWSVHLSVHLKGVVSTSEGGCQYT